MQVAKDTVVTLSYRVTDPDGNLIDGGERPLVYLHGGYDGIFSRIEEMLQGKAIGEQLEVKLLPEDAFGEYDAELVRVEALSMFPEGIQVGMQFERATEDDDDEIVYTITDIEGDKVVVDGNHPLSGTALIFNCTIADVRAATAEELTHGHVHGPEGHHHH
jgi:FKBP-type peptidyl-prolyl cis-trans isomerase SlyD